MRDYAVVLILVAAFPVGLIRPYFGLLVYTWVSFMYPHMLAWSFAQSFPAAKLAAISTIIGTLVNRAGDTAPLRQRETAAMVLLWCTFTVSSVFAFYPEWAWDQWQDVSKVIFMAVLTSMLITSRERVRYLLLVIGLSIGFYAIKGGLFSIRTGGESMVLGPGTSIIAANNAIGLALNMALPILWYLARNERGYKKVLLYAMFSMAVPAILFTYSRGSVVALGVVLLAMILRSNRFVLLGIVLIGALLVVPFAPQGWWDRQKTTLEYENDGSAMSRIDNWKVSWRIALDTPLTGAGFQFYSYETFQKYAPEFLGKYGREWDTHNVFFGILASHGFPGLAFFLAMIGFSFLTCWHVKRRVRLRADLKWVADCADMVQLSFLAFIANGMFVNMEYFDLVYDLVAIAMALKIICYRELSVEQTEESPLVPDAVPATL